MAARGYEFYLRVVKVSLTSERSEFPHKTQLFKFIFETAKIVTYRKMSLIAISLQVKYKNSVFTARGEDMIL